MSFIDVVTTLFSPGLWRCYLIHRATGWHFDERYRVICRKCGREWAQ
jgi:hypothetical protein